MGSNNTPFWDRNIDGHVDRPPPLYLSRYRLGFLDEGFNTDGDFYPRELISVYLIEIDR